MGYVERVSRAGHGAAPCAVALPKTIPDARRRRGRYGPGWRGALHRLVGTEGNAPKHVCADPCVTRVEANAF